MLARAEQTDRASAVTASNPARGSDQRERRGAAPFSPPAGGLREILDRCRKDVGACVHRAVEISGNAVYNAGQAIGNIVKEAREQVSDQQRIVGRIDADAHEGGEGIGASIAAQTREVSVFVGELVGHTSAQERAADFAATLTTDIVKLARDIDRIAFQSRLLSINARIECAHLGTRGNALSVITNEMNTVSEEIANANSNIARIAAELVRVLPEIAKQAGAIHRASDEFSLHFAERQAETARVFAELLSATRSAMEQAQARVERILEMSQSALSVMQFQDPMAQDLMKLEGMVERATGDAERLGLAVTPMASDSAPMAVEQAPPQMPSIPPDEPAQSAGDVMLF